MYDWIVLIVSYFNILTWNNLVGLTRPKPPLQPKPKHLAGFRLNKPTLSTKAVTAPSQDHGYVNMPSIDKNTDIPPVVAVGEKQADSLDRAGASEQEEEQQYSPAAVLKLFNSRIPVIMRGGGKHQQVYSRKDSGISMDEDLESARSSGSDFEATIIEVGGPSMDQRDEVNGGLDQKVKVCCWSVSLSLIYSSLYIMQF